MPKRYIDADEFEKRIKPYDTDDPVDKALYNFALNKMLCTPTADVVEAPRWIPVTERLPEEDEVIYNSIGIKGERQRSDRVLAIDSTGFIHCGYFIKSCKRHEYHGNGKKNEYSDNGTASWEFGDHYDFNPNNWIVPVNASIVAWMPLPEPYREEADNADANGG